MYEVKYNWETGRFNTFKDFSSYGTSRGSLTHRPPLGLSKQMKTGIYYSLKELFDLSILCDFQKAFYSLGIIQNTSQNI